MSSDSLGSVHRIQGWSFQVLYPEKIIEQVTKLSRLKRNQAVSLFCRETSGYFDVDEAQLRKYEQRLKPDILII
jgi:hypothetical protein